MQDSYPTTLCHSTVSHESLSQRTVWQNAQKEARLVVSAGWAGCRRHRPLNTLPFTSQLNVPTEPHAHIHLVQSTVMQRRRTSGSRMHSVHEGQPQPVASQRRTAPNTNRHPAAAPAQPDTGPGPSLPPSTTPHSNGSGVDRPHDDTFNAHLQPSPTLFAYTHPPKWLQNNHLQTLLRRAPLHRSLLRPYQCQQRQRMLPLERRLELLLRPSTAMARQSRSKS